MNRKFGRPIPVAARYKAGVYGPWDFWLESRRRHRNLCLTNVVLSGGGLCYGPILRPAASYQVRCAYSVIEEAHRGGLGPIQHSSRERKEGKFV